MNVTYRLAGIDGEATEDRVESLAEAEENEPNNQNAEKKFGVTHALVKEFESKKRSGQYTNGVKVLNEVLANLGSLNT